jgi:hypothetical protein
MWESVLKKEQWEIQINPDYKTILFNVTKSPSHDEKVTLRLSQAELFELMHTFLSINRSFNNESAYFEELDRADSA